VTTPPATTALGPSVLLGASLLSTFVLARRTLASSRSDGLAELVGTHGGPPPARSRQATRSSLPTPTHPAWRSLALGAPLGWFGFHLAGAGGLVAGAAIGMASPFLVAARRRRGRQETLERLVAEVAESVALAVRSGLSIRQALQFTSGEVDEPMRSSVQELLRTNSLGTPLERGITAWAADIGTDEARLLAIVLTIHVRSGGDLGGALQEVAATIRHRISVRRELRAMSAQGRTSGAILGSLPIVFFLVLAVTSRSELAPVYRSPAGVAMVSGGLVLELLAYLWIRRLLRVKV
jgi:tight adherence protein B